MRGIQAQQQPGKLFSTVWNRAYCWHFSVRIRSAHLLLLMSMSARRQPSQDPALTLLCYRGAKDIAGRTAFNMAVLCGSGVGLLSTLAEEPARPVRPPLNNRAAPSY